MTTDRSKFFTKIYEDMESDARISWDAKGLFARLEKNIRRFAEPDGGWTGAIGDLMASLGMTRYALRRATAELEKRGLITVTRVNGRTSRYVILHLESPLLPFAEPVRKSNGCDTETCSKIERVGHRNRFENRTGTGAKSERVPVRNSHRTGSKFERHPCETRTGLADILISVYKSNPEQSDNNINSIARNCAEVSKGVDDVGVFERLVVRGIGRSKLAEIRREHTADEIEHAEAFADDLEKRGIAKHWPGLFLDALRAGPADRPLPAGVMTQSQRRAQTEESARIRESSQRSAETRNRFVEDAETWFDQNADMAVTLFESLPQAKRRELRTPIGGRFYLFQMFREGQYRATCSGRTQAMA